MHTNKAILIIIVVKMEQCINREGGVVGERAHRIMIM